MAETHQTNVEELAEVKADSKPKKLHSNTQQRLQPATSKLVHSAPASEETDGNSPGGSDKAAFF